jgi:hypothetical protein
MPNITTVMSPCITASSLGRPRKWLHCRSCVAADAVMMVVTVIVSGHPVYSAATPKGAARSERISPRA